MTPIDEYRFGVRFPNLTGPTGPTVFLKVKSMTAAAAVYPREHGDDAAEGPLPLIIPGLDREPVSSRMKVKNSSRNRRTKPR